MRITATLTLIAGGVLWGSLAIVGDVNGVATKPVAKTAVPKPRVRVVFATPDQCKIHGHGHAFTATMADGNISWLCPDFTALTVHVKDL